MALKSRARKRTVALPGDVPTFAHAKGFRSCSTAPSPSSQASRSIVGEKQLWEIDVIDAIRLATSPLVDAERAISKREDKSRGGAQDSTELTLTLTA